MGCQDGPEVLVIGLKYSWVGIYRPKFRGQSPALTVDLDDFPGNIPLHRKRWAKIFLKFLIYLHLQGKKASVRVWPPYGALLLLFTRLFLACVCSCARFSQWFFLISQQFFFKKKLEIRPLLSALLFAQLVARTRGCSPRASALRCRLAGAWRVFFSPDPTRRTPGLLWVPTLNLVDLPGLIAVRCNDEADPADLSAKTRDIPTQAWGVRVRWGHLNVWVPLVFC